MPSQHLLRAFALAALLPAGIMASACSDGQPEGDSKRASKSGTTTGGDTGGQTTKTTGKGKDGGGGGESGGGTDGDAVPAANAKEYFEANLLPEFDGACSSCHAEPRIQVATRGPLSIFSYKAMLAMLGTAEGPRAEATPATANKLYRKIRGVTQHTGGDGCSASGIDTKLCTALYEWWKLEFPGKDPGPMQDDAGGGGPSGGDDGGSGATGVNGNIDLVTVRGFVTGWAADDDDLTATVTVDIYVDGPAGSGTKIATVQAREMAYDAGRKGDHGFSLTLPEAARDGASRKLYAYGTRPGGGAPVALTPDGVSYKAFTPKAAGRSYWEANIRAIVQAENGCKRCHGLLTYDSQWGTLASPQPGSAGGTETGNNLYQNSSGQSHGGGNQCAGNNLCNSLRQWWTLEFGG